MWAPLILSRVALLTSLRTLALRDLKTSADVTSLSSSSLTCLAMPIWVDITTLSWLHPCPNIRELQLAVRNPWYPPGICSDDLLTTCSLSHVIHLVLCSFTCSLQFMLTCSFAFPLFSLSLSSVSLHDGIDFGVLSTHCPNLTHLRIHGHTGNHLQAYHFKAMLTITSLRLLELEQCSCSYGDAFTQGVISNSPLGLKLQAEQSHSHSHSHSHSPHIHDFILSLKSWSNLLHEVQTQQSTWKYVKKTHDGYMRYQLRIQATNKQ